jgi:tetratricopeptide (TPR) repeat protein
MGTDKADTPDALFAAATAAHRNGKLPDAAALYRRILAISRSYPDVLHQLGLIEHQTGAHDVAVGLIREAIVLEPKQPSYHSNLASALIETGDFGGAVSAAQRAITLLPSYAPAYANLGVAYLRSGNPNAAGQALQRAVALSPGNTIAQYWLGRALQDQERFAEAAACYRAVIANAPRYADAHCNLCYVLTMLGDLTAGAAHAREAIALSPDYADAHNNLGYALAALGDFEGAKASYAQALAHDPHYVAAYNNLGNLHKDLGNLPAAEAAYRQALAIQPDFARAQFNLADIKTFRERDGDVAALETQLASAAGTLPHAHYLHFAMAKALEDIGAYDEAFAQLQAGGALKRASLPYDEPKLLAYLHDMARLYDPQLLARFAGDGDPSTVPIFIIGMPRAGTTLVEQILASHGEVLGGGERLDFDAVMAAVLPPGSAAERIGGLDPARLQALGAGYLARLPALVPGQTRITDKLPANFMHAGLIHLALPGAKIVHVLRDPADTCLSCYSKLFDVGQEFTYDLSELGRYYVAYRRLMDHWRTVMPGTIHEISYEALVADMEGETRRLLEFCGLEWDPACLAFHENARPVQTASATQVRKPLYASSVGRWKRYERHLGPLLTELAKL